MSQYIRIAFDILNKYRSITNVHAIITSSTVSDLSAVSAFISLELQKSTHHVISLVDPENDNRVLTQPVPNATHKHLLGYGNVAYDLNTNTSVPVVANVPYFVYIYSIDNGVQQVKSHGMFETVIVTELIQDFSVTKSVNIVMGTIITNRSSVVKSVACDTDNLSIGEIKRLCAYETMPSVTSVANVLCALPDISTLYFAQSNTTGTLSSFSNSVYVYVIAYDSTTQTTTMRIQLV